jgi:outer membrane protein OmpA-like peptidoglycan-associated protein
MRTIKIRDSWAWLLAMSGSLWLSGCITIPGVRGPCAAPTCCPMYVAAPPAPEPPKPKIALKGVNFDFDKSDIRPDAKAILDEDTQILREHILRDRSDAHVIVEGHTDGKGTNSYNDRLAMRRAVAVKNYLVANGISASATLVAGHGKREPIASNQTDEGRAENRRVELRVRD